MPDIYFDVDVALSEVPVNLMPLLDSTDFLTIEDAVAYNAAGMALNWHFVTSAGAYTVTAVTPTTAGTYDWTDQGTAGVYTIEIPATGGASINNDTEGYGWFTGVATGILPWRGPVCGFRAAAINDSLMDTNTTGLLAPTTAGRTLDVAATGEAGLDFSNVLLPTTGPIPALGVIESGTAQSATSTTLVARAAGTDDLIKAGMTLLAYGSTQGYWQSVMVSSVSGDTLTIAAWPMAVTPSGTITYLVFGTPTIPSTLPITANATQLAGQTVTAAAGVTFPTSVASPTNITAGTITTATNVTTVNGLAASVITAASIAADAGTEIGTAVWATTTRSLTVLDEDSTTLDLDATIRAAVGLASANMDTQIAGVISDTNDIQARLPAALVSGRMDASVGAMAANVITAAATAADFGAEVADAVWDEALAGHVAAGSSGEAMAAAGTAGDPWTTALPGAYAAGQAGYVLGTNLNATVSSRASQTSLDTVDDLLDTEVAAIKAKTDQLTFTVANQLDANTESINATTVNGTGTSGDKWRGA